MELWRGDWSFFRLMPFSLGRSLLLRIRRLQQQQQQRQQQRQHGHGRTWAGKRRGSSFYDLCSGGAAFFFLGVPPKRTAILFPKHCLLCLIFYSWCARFGTHNSTHAQDIVRTGKISLTMVVHCGLEVGSLCDRTALPRRRIALTVYSGRVVASSSSPHSDGQLLLRSHLTNDSD